MIIAAWREHRASVPTHPDVGLSATIEACMPAPEVKWIDGGPLANLRYSRYWREREGARGCAAGGPRDGRPRGVRGRSDRVEGTGILVTRLWYMRFNASPSRVLENHGAMSAPAAVGSPAMVPALRVRDFRFTSGTSF